MVNRRSFFKLVALGSLCVTTRSREEALAAVRFDRNWCNVSKTQPMMGTFVNISLFHESQTLGEEAIEVTFDLMRSKEALLTRFCEQSPIGILNREGFLADITPEVREVFRFSFQFHRESRGAFVTINKKGQLRGCIGYIEGRGPLYKTVEKMAEEAAFRDPRFDPVKERELPELEIEISVLTPLKKITDINEIEVGKHGIYIKKGWNSGLLLPQVATDYGWDRLTFLEHTCQKAGLPANAWKEKNTEIYIFSADIF